MRFLKPGASAATAHHAGEKRMVACPSHCRPSPTLVDLAVVELDACHISNWLMAWREYNAAPPANSVWRRTAWPRSWSNSRGIAGRGERKARAGNEQLVHESPILCFFYSPAPIQKYADRSDMRAADRGLHLGSSCRRIQDTCRGFASSAERRNSKSSGPSRYETTSSLLAHPGAQRRPLVAVMQKQ